MNQTERELIVAQRSHWPTSEILTPNDVIEWAINNETHMRHVLMTIQYRCGVFYRIPLSDGREYRGFRYGIAGPDYLSF